MRKFLLFIFSFFLLFFVTSSDVHADWELLTDPTTVAAGTYTTDAANIYLTGDKFGLGEDSTLKVVTEFTRTVIITFKGLSGSETYDICLSTACISAAGKSKDWDELADGGPDRERVETDSKEAENGFLKLYLCADGQEALKLADDTNNCGEGDYFHGRHVYGLVIGKDNNIIESATFFVSMYYPYVRVEPGRIKPGEEIKVYIAGTRPPHDNKDRNNYAVEIASADDPSRVFQQDCIRVEPREGWTASSPKTSETVVTFAGRQAGDYIIKINEQANEGGILVGREGCSAEFTYYWILIRVRDADFWARNSEGNSTVEIITDPNGSDIAGGKKGKRAPLPPCAEYDQDITTEEAKYTANCVKLKTGLGIDIGTKAEKFIGDIFGIVLGLSGGLALILIIYGGYQLMASRGKPESMEAARDQITAAIIGLLFIIFAFVILQVIGVDILGIPEFGK
ncbi:MAG: hypothetical protein AAB531_04615 [Patescibacteria group bacterium]